MLRELLPEPGAPFDTDADDIRSTLAELYRLPPGPFLRTNLIASVDGTASDAAGTSEGLGNAADRKILGAIRATSDTVLVGAATLRAEGMIIPKSTHLTILTASGRLDGVETREALTADRVLVVGPADAETAARDSFPGDLEFLAIGSSGRPEVGAVITALRERGLEQIVCEGGPQLAGQLVDAGLVDEFCISTAPVLVGGAFPPFGSARRAPVRLELFALLVDDEGGLYARWRPRRDAAA